MQAKGVDPLRAELERTAAEDAAARAATTTGEAGA